ncbi:hypothetical protein [uncultured Helicobacter sp.]|uniref:hypothetical protein n=1 Tax=uncultured Helicobacter sp. TaxID=175537 RepID=UPI00260172ED|nr:hypothetical protein [uncultured Helicobacter sp.]
MKYEIESFELTKESFNLLITEAGFNTKKDFARFVNLPYNSINNWGNNGNKFPKYVMTLMIALIKSRKYDSLMKSSSIMLECEKLKDENVKLKSIIHNLEAEVKKFEVLKKSINRINLYANREAESLK